MINWVIENLSTIIVSLILLLVVFMIIRSQIKTKGSCGCESCGGCPMAGKCHSKEK